jgi:uncharacterized protein YkwD
LFASPPAAAYAPPVQLNVVTLLLLLPLAVTSACAGDDAARKAAPDDDPVPSWLRGGGASAAALVRDPQLDEAASLLCSAEGTRLDRQTRHLLALSVGQLETAVFLGRSALEAQTKARGSAPALLAALRATHVGLAEGTRAGEERCLAVVGARRLLKLTSPVPAAIGVDDAFPLEGKVLGEPATEIVLFATRPGGSVSRTPIPVNNGYFSQLITPRRGAGRYTLELMLDRGGVPEVALLWPFRVGEPGEGGPLPPFPAVLFGDEGHDDLALSHRAEALVQRLRTEQEIDVLKVAPELLRVATSRAEALSSEAGLGHRRPSGRTPLDDLQRREPGFEVLRLAEVQAQASTLKDAWLALLRSPSHRYELVHPQSTHFGAIVHSGRDAAGRRLVTLEVLLARRYSKHLLRRYSAELLRRINEARKAAGHDALRGDRTLSQVCARQAAFMADTGTAADGGLGEPVADLASALGTVTDVRSQLAALDDPFRLAPGGVALEPAMDAVGVAVAPERDGDRFMVCVLVGRSAPDDGG